MDEMKHSGDSVPRRSLCRCVCWLFVVPVLATSALHFLVTGSPVPLCRAQDLQKPLPVLDIQRSGLKLADDSVVALPGIKELPTSSVVFNKALAHGVEVDVAGHVWGLLRVQHWCGHDPYIYDRRRVNLSELAAALHPQGMDLDHLSHEEREAVRSLLPMPPTRLHHYGKRGWSTRNLDYLRWARCCLDEDLQASLRAD
ncbi:MAG: hypothetical protein ACI8W8_001334 [Rhodothermales bacterium]